MPKKVPTTKKRTDGDSKKTVPGESSKKIVRKDGATITVTDQRAVAAPSGRTAQHNDTGQALSQANAHMERAWEKIYEGRGKTRKAA